MKRSNKLVLITTVILLFVAALLSTENVTTAHIGAGPTIQSCNNFGNPVDHFAAGTTVCIKGSGFQPNSHYYVLVYNDGVCSPSGDHIGDITWYEGQKFFGDDRQVLWTQDVSTTSAGDLELINVVDVVGSMYECYDVVVTKGYGDDILSWTYNSATDVLDDNINCFTAHIGAGPTVQSCDEFGNPADDFVVGTTAFIKGSGFQPNSHYYVLVYNDGICSPGGHDHSGDITWYEGQKFFGDDRQVLWILDVGTTSAGDLEPINVVDEVGPMYQCYAVIVTQGDGDDVLSWTYNSATDALDDNNTCFHDAAGFFVVPEYVFGALMALGACFGAFFVVKHKSLRLPSIRR